MDTLPDSLALVATLLVLALGLLAAGHAVIWRRDSRAAVLWVGLIAFAPVVGSLLYALFGINRVRRRARAIRSAFRAGRAPVPDAATPGPLPAESAHLAPLARLAERVVGAPLSAGNQVLPLRDGDEAFPAMLAAIDAAQASVALSTYIFDADRVGLEFVDRLGAAVRRGVAVRVLVDDAGSQYSLPRITSPLRRAGVPAARFHPRFLFLPTPAMNLRCHRKILVVDGRVGFTGGINLREGHRLALDPRRPVRDLHFRLEGPVVRRLLDVFAEDWGFTTREALVGPAWAVPDVPARGPTLARVLPGGPDHRIETLRWVLLGALDVAQRRVRVVTPYFLPDPSLISALCTAALRGVDVEILLPERSNLPYVDWATRAILWQVLERGCRVRFAGPPFDHAKLAVVDGAWSAFGSSNWDTRSLRLNFELDVETYDPSLAAQLEGLYEERRARSREVTLEEMDARPLPLRLRDGVARLFMPVL